MRSILPIHNDKRQQNTWSICINIEIHNSWFQKLSHLSSVSEPFNSGSSGDFSGHDLGDVYSALLLALKPEPPTLDHPLQNAPQLQFVVVYTHIIHCHKNVMGTEINM